MPGVTKAKVDFEKKTVAVTFDPDNASPATPTKATSDAGVSFHCSLLKFFMNDLVLESVLVLASVPCLRLRQARNDAERRLSVFLRMRWLQDPAAVKGGGLLRFLFLRFGKVSPDAGRELHLFYSLSNSLPVEWTTP